MCPQQTAFGTDIHVGVLSITRSQCGLRTTLQWMDDASKRPAPMLFGTGFAHDLKSDVIQVTMAEHRVGLIGR